MTLVEAMVAMSLLAMGLLAFLGTFIQSRRVTEATVLHAAATSLIYGLIEQMKGLEYVAYLPSNVADPEAPTGTTPPFVRLRLNQDTNVWLRVVYTSDPNNPRGPVSTPPLSATAESLGAINNTISSLPLSTVGGATSQRLNLTIWVWIDEMRDRDRDVADVKKITMVYTYSFNDGNRVRTIRDREVILRTRFDQ